MMQDFIIIRKGTEPKTAFKKSMKIIWDYILHNSTNLKVDGRIMINLSKREDK